MKIIFKNVEQPHFRDLNEACVKAVACLYTVTPDILFQFASNSCTIQAWNEIFRMPARAGLFV